MTDVDKKRTISIIVPVWNEQDSIKPLVERIDNTAKEHDLLYEVIIIDDRSTDNSRIIARSLSARYPVSVFVKRGKKGKAQSLLEGFAHARHALLCMIDADLQYPPEAIPRMVAKIAKGADIVIANRKEKRVNALRKFITRIYATFFSKLLHNFSCDVQSGLKIFRREIVERIYLNPSPWAFDLELLVRARNAGYKIATEDIVFSQRQAGKSKIRLVSASFQIGWTAIKLRLLRPEIIPFSPTQQLIKGKGFHYKGREFIHHSGLPFENTAFHRLSGTQILFIIAMVEILLLGIVLDWHFTVLLIVAVITVLYFIDLLFNLFLIFRNFSTPAEIVITEKSLHAQQNKVWPMYTVFCPLYKEWQVLPQFVTAMSRLDYPKDKLQVMLLLEQDDKETIKHVKNYNLPPYFEVVIVPHSFPKTKPKACNYGLMLAKGKYTVIYDAEDIPDPLQLKKSVLAFEKSGSDIVCIQAKLNFYNPTQNLLTRMFTAEYSLWFDLVLTGLQSIHAPIPLGGTSNHFRTRDLKSLKGWDSFNVTEDCDLGIRLVKQGYHTAVIDSVTLEEANVSLSNWFWQRTRWIKGYMQTYFVHMRDPREFLRRWNEPHVITFQLVVGGKILSMFINPAMWTITALYIAYRAHVGAFIESFFPTPILYMGVISLIVGNFLYVYYYMIGCAKHGHHELVKYGIFVPFYWLAMSIASWMALYKLITAPHHWSKTKHGLHLNNKKAISSIKKTIGNSLLDGDIVNRPPVRITPALTGI